MTRKIITSGFSYREILLGAAMVFIASCSPKAPHERICCAQSADGELISYNVFGSGDITLIFVHGWSCDSRYWREQVPYFAKRYRVVTVDLAGHGHSGQSRKIYSLEGFGQDVKAVVEELDAKKVVLIGHSLGGGVIAEAARLMPQHVTGLIGVDTLHNVEGAMNREEVKRILDGYKKDFRGSVRKFVEQMMVEDTNPELKKWIIDDISSAPANVAISAFEEYAAKLEDKKLANVFKEIKAPVRCVNADLWPTDFEANRRYMSSFDAEIMRGVGHCLMLERPAEFNKLLERSIKEIIGKK
ncbi:MAG: alpha/beta hydrolase [Sedimentisphaerales bacterium]|nr:alpha/beta hydrolase [Sedimentisphaerales bacterium]